jgi:hypothetical protein
MERRPRTWACAQLGLARRKTAHPIHSCFTTAVYEWRPRDFLSRVRIQEQGLQAREVRRFVDLKQHREEQCLTELPDIFIVPVAVVKKWKRFPPKESFVKPTEQELLRYKNRKGWKMLLLELGIPVE